MTRAEAIQTLQANAKLLHFEHPHLGIKEAIEVVIEALSRTSLPSNLNDAAEEWANKVELAANYNDEWINHEDIFNAFKAGAEWMAGKWETIDGEITTTSDNGWEIIQIPKKLYPLGTKVTVQIRKK